jgi:Leucine-rich repeat (LRR) protein
LLEDFFQVGRDEILDLVVPVASREGIRQLLKDGYAVNQITPNQNLYEIKFSGKQNSLPDLRKLLELKQQIVWLQLTDCGITDEQLKIIAGLQNLYKLNISRNAISDTGVKHLLALPKLRVLNLYGSDITDAGVRELAGMPSLKNLYVWETKVDTLRMDTFTSLRKDLEIIYKIKDN